VQQRLEGLHTCASLANVRFSEMAAAAVAAFESRSAVRFDTTKPNIADNAFAADESLYQRIGYFPTISLTQGLAREAARRRSLA
jgi:nucleoside-diphosphate-sugar epimerase